ncbi:hypothetical protein FQV39_10400 [Bosea sp. F3-2]|uniref:hypothetical protein n=1 Tax=Bosea sp. F3-2 TaxID=2599640 RepID=UPI0011EF5759|nr:hypothetical protein [Bosea sp. F3-2]QEL22934.1 hypothetical protein FQV39_10400 [Bosea sp. F3-2]
MKLGQSLSASPGAVFDLFDPGEQTTFLSAMDTSRSELSDRFTASELLNWIVQQRSAFVLMAADIAGFLTRIEASLKGNVEFIVANQNGNDVQIAFGPQIRSLLLVAASWVRQATPDIDKQLEIIKREVAALSRDARPTFVKRDQGIGRQLRDLGDQTGSPIWHMQANLMQRSEREVHPSDIRVMREVRDALALAQQRLEAQLADHPAADAVTQPLRTMGGQIATALRQIEGKASREYGGPPTRLDMRRGRHIELAIGEIESLARQALQMDATGSEVLEAMGLALWKERWRIYELWILCSVCMTFANGCEQIDTLDRINDGRWTLKYTRDPKPAIAFAIGDRWIDLYYQYFQKGTDRANMPDIALRDRTSRRWLAIVDPKMGETYSAKDHQEVCLRYADAFDAQMSAIASYFPEEASVETLAHERSALIFSGLRPASAASLHRALSTAAREIGVPLPSKSVAVLADVSGSTDRHRALIASAVATALANDPQVDRIGSLVASFAETWIAKRSVSDYLASPVLTESGGGTNHKIAFETAVTHLSKVAGEKEIWLFGDGDGAQFDAAAMVEQGIRVRANLVKGPVPASLQDACAATGGSAIALE